MRTSLLFLLVSLSLGLSALAGQTRHIPFMLGYRDSALTGIMITREDDDAIVGSMVNEFGISALDFSYDRRKDKVKLLSVAPFLDRWYIRRTLRRDLRYCLHQIYRLNWQGKEPYTVDRIGDTLTVVNPRRGLTYTFTLQ